MAEESSRGPRRWLVRFGYDGAGFGGWARQPGRRTVEGTIRASLARLGIARSPEAADLEVASRTDAGVSARANALALYSERTGPALLRALNGTAPDLFFSAARAIPPELRVRSAVRRTYRYHLPGGRERAERLRTGVQLLGTHLDARSFARGFPTDAPRPYPIEAIAVDSDGEGIVLQIRARAFAWGMVRKIVGALGEWEGGRVDDAVLRAAADGTRRRSFPLAPADGLVLWEVEYPEEWEVWTPRLLAHQRRHFAEERRAAGARARVLHEVDPTP